MIFRADRRGRRIGSSQVYLGDILDTGGATFQNGLVEPAGMVTFVFAFVQPGAENSRPGCGTFKAADFESVFRANEDKVRKSRLVNLCENPGLNISGGKISARFIIGAFHHSKGNLAEARRVGSAGYMPGRTVGGGERGVGLQSGRKRQAA
jgi:hypothetical protein